MARISMRWGNFLLIDKRFLQAGDGPEAVESAIVEAEPAVKKTLEKYPKVWVMRLCENASAAFTGGIGDLDDGTNLPVENLQEPYRAFADLFRDRGFTVSLMSASEEGETKGLCLLVSLE